MFLVLMLLLFLNPQTYLQGLVKTVPTIADVLLLLYILWYSEWRNFCILHSSLLCSPDGWCLGSRLLYNCIFLLLLIYNYHCVYLYGFDLEYLLIVYVLVVFVLIYYYVIVYICPSFRILHWLCFNKSN